jgi:hypothetical protein
VGNNFTIYLDVIADSDSVDTLPNPIDNILAQLATVWVPIATANGLALTFALGSKTSPPNPLIPIPPGINVVTGAIPPSGVKVFELTVGRGKSADEPTRSSRTSYVKYETGLGYIYELPNQLANPVPATSHEMGHILGLADRYYQAVYWLDDQAINRTCKQIREGQYVVPPDPTGNDFSGGQPDVITGGNQLPRLAVRVSLPMSQIMVPAESEYIPTANLMSTNAPIITPAQLQIIRNSQCEESYRKTNWVAVLGEWRRFAPPPNPTAIPAGANAAAPDFPRNDLRSDLSTWIFPAWEARPLDGGRGLLFFGPGDVITPHRYGCVSSHSKGKNDGDINHASRLAMAMGKTRVHAFSSATFKATKDTDWKTIHPDWMCHVRQMIHDLMKL